MPADDLTDPAPATTFAHLDATTVLSRGIAELGIYPAVDPLDSTSRILDANIIGEEHYSVARDVQKVLQVRTVTLLYILCVPYLQLAQKQSIVIELVYHWCLWVKLLLAIYTKSGGCLHSNSATEFPNHVLVFANLKKIPEDKLL